MLNNDLKKLMQDNLRYSETTHQLLTDNNATEHQGIKELLEKNLRYAQAIYLATEKIRKYILWLKIMSLVKILMILVPLILAIIYLPPLFENLLGPYLDLLRGSDSAGVIGLGGLLNK